MPRRLWGRTKFARADVLRRDRKAEQTTQEKQKDHVAESIQFFDLGIVVVLYLRTRRNQGDKTRAWLSSGSVAANAFGRVLSGGVLAADSPLLRTKGQMPISSCVNASERLWSHPP